MFRRAFIYLRRLKKRNISLLLVMTLVLLLLMGGIAVYSGIQNSMEMLYQGLEGHFQVSSADPSCPIDDHFISEITDENSIVRYNATNEMYLSLPDMLLIPGRFYGSGSAEEHMTRFISNTRSSDYSYFISKRYELISGSHIADNDSGTAIISDNLANMNGYKVGDTFTAEIVESSLNLFEDTAKGKSCTFRISGIYKNNYEQNVSADTAECNIEDNYIFIDNYTGKEIASYLQGNRKSVYSEGVQFFTASPRDIDKTIDKIKETMDLGAREIDTTNFVYEKSEAPLQSMTLLTRIYLGIITFAGILLLFGIMQIHLKARKNETAIFLSLGYKKSSIIMQHMAENLILYLLAWIIAVIFAYFAVTVFNSFFAGMSLHFAVGEACISGAIGLLVVILATLFSQLLVVRFSPRRILSTFS